jgi:hypothetical protein
MDMRSALTILLPLLACGQAAAAGSDERACERALALANDGRLAAALLRPAPSQPGDDERWKRGDPQRWGYVAGAYAIARSDGSHQRLLAVEQGGSCHSLGLALDDGSELTLEPLVQPEETFGLDLVPLRIDGEWFALAVSRDRGRFAPLALGRLEARRLVPLCRFEATGEVRRVQAAAADPVCSAFIAAQVDAGEWQPVDDEEIPAKRVAAHEAARAGLDWHGLGPRTTWKLVHESGAGCGMSYEWLALDSGTVEPALDVASATGRALFPEVERERFAHGPWRLDGVFVHEARTWFAGQPQWGETVLGDYAVYRVDSDGVHMQCRYRHLPQVRLVREPPS